MRPGSGRAWTAIACCLLAACQRPSAPSGASNDAGAARPLGESRDRSSGESLIRAPLPEGWTAQASHDTFRAGPPSHWVFRVDRTPDSASELPLPAELKSHFIEDFPQAKLSKQSEKNSSDVSILVFLLSAGAGDGGSRASAVMLGAKRIGRDLFLCATLPGQTLAEAQLAASTCEGLWLEAP